MEPEVQALPEEAAIPAISRLIRTDSISMPLKEMLTLLGIRRGVPMGGPLRWASGIVDRIPSARRAESFADVRYDFVAFAVGHLKSEARADDPCRVFRACASVSFLAAAHRLRLERGISIGKKNTNALGAVELVGGEAQHIDAEFLHIQVQISGRLHGIGVKDDAMAVLVLRIAYDLGYLTDGLDCACLIVDGHYGDDGGFGSDGFGYLIGSR